MFALTGAQDDSLPHRLRGISRIAAFVTAAQRGAMTLEQLTQVAANVVGATQRQLPPEIRPLALGVAVHYDAVPAEDVLAEGFEPDILGLFAGDPHGTELSHDNPVPPQILLYLDNLWDFAEEDLAIFKEEVRTTYLHELGHFLGWDEDDVAARGLD